MSAGTGKHVSEKGRQFLVSWKVGSSRDQEVGEMREFRIQNKSRQSDSSWRLHFSTLVEPVQNVCVLLIGVVGVQNPWKKMIHLESSLKRKRKKPLPV